MINAYKSHEVSTREGKEPFTLAVDQCINGEKLEAIFKLSEQ